ncbi:MAG TPA: M1 family aminopeptidase, partial [Thermomicrobiales bacterium]|nr:M1 family aminopeptidase [Thermomicrobiales bacterium]
PTSENGDPVFSNTSQYDVSVTAPSAWEVAATGTVVANKVSGESRTQQVITGPVRDFSIVANSQFDSVSDVVDGTTVTSWFLPGDDRVGNAVLTYASQAIALYSTLFGSYPYVEFDVVPVDLHGASGVEFPQLIYLAQSYYTADQSLDVPNYLDFTVAHEVMHQWWYGMVGNNQYLHAFTDEGLTNFVSSLIYFTQEYGEDAGSKIFTGACLSSFDASVKDGADQIVDTPTDAFDTTNDYVWAAYSKAPVGFDAIYNQIGEQAFVAGLADYLKENAFGIAQPDDMLAAFEEASGQDLTALWKHWFDERAGAYDV